MLSAFGPRQRNGLWLGPALFSLTVLFLHPEGVSPLAVKTLGVSLLMVVWWVTEALPLAITGLIPLALFPLLGVEKLSTVAPHYANPIILMFLGGFILAGAVQRWHLHKRVAIKIILTIGTEPSRMILGFMIATAFLSMWMSNTAVTLMMLPIGLSTAELFMATNDAEDDSGRHFTIALMLGIAYAASIGGAATLIGTPPTGMLAGYFFENYQIKIDFLDWMIVAFPVTMIALPVTWFMLTKWQFPIHAHSRALEGRLREELEILGPVSRQEKRVMMVFGGVIFLWLTQNFIRQIAPMIHINNTNVAILGAIALFIVPSHFRKGEFLLNHKWMEYVDWNILVLFGGGLSLASIVNTSGLASWLGQYIHVLNGLPTPVLLVMVTLITIFATELVSNTATTAILLPIIGALAIARNDLSLLFPIALSASYAFMLPVSTPPNALAFSSGYIELRDMIRAGFILNTLSVVVISTVVYFMAKYAI